MPSTPLARLAAPLIAAVALALPGAAHAQTLTTANCPAGTPTWTVAVQLFWTSNQASLDRAATIDGVLANLQRAADLLGELSACNVAPSFVIEDRSDQFAVGPDDTRAGGGNLPALPAGVNAVIARAPAARRDGGFSDENRIVEAVRADRDPARPGTTSPDAEALIVIHELLHTFHWWYRTPLGWPVEDVHGACQRPDYATSDPTVSCLLQRSWFADLLQGKVLEDGQARGLGAEVLRGQQPPAPHQTTYEPSNDQPAVTLIPTTPPRVAAPEVHLSISDRQQILYAAGSLIGRNAQLSIARGGPLQTTTIVLAAQQPLTLPADWTTVLVVAVDDDGQRYSHRVDRILPRKLAELISVTRQGRYAVIAASRGLRGRLVTIRVRRGHRPAQRTTRKINGLLRVRLPKGWQTVTATVVAADGTTVRGRLAAPSRNSPFAAAGRNRTVDSYLRR